MTQLHGPDEDVERVEGSDVPLAMLQQASAAAIGEHDTSTMSPAERRHLGHDVRMEDAENTHGPEAEGAVPPPAFGQHYGDLRDEREGFGTKASVADDGRVNIRINQKHRKLSASILPTLKRQQQVRDGEHAPPPPYIPPALGGDSRTPPPPPMNVVIQIVGSRGDVQPFVALGKVLKETYGHRVRLATHGVFNNFVTENGLEFFDIGADPAALMAFMVKNPGLMPGFDALRAGDVGQRRKEVAEYLRGCWRSCFETGDGSGPEATDETIEDWTAPRATEDYRLMPFVADCIIANPPSFAHVHIAEKMGIPCHLYFTMPYSPTQAFPHPLANIQTTNADENLTNYISYTLIDMLTWQGLGDVINRFRQRSLGLEPVSLMWAPGMLQRLRVPFTYCWSPALIPKPKDWGANINISGFFFLDLATNFTPDPDLKAFLDAGPPPVYIGFGSIVLDDPNEMTKLLFDAVRKTGQRALVSKGWGGMGADELGKPDNVFMLGNVPHDWLFKRVSCVVHHGGAGTTAAGITAGRPTVVVPFFGDQPFWGSMVARAGAGPPPIPNKQLTSDNLAEAIMKCLEPESQDRAHELAAKIAEERGTDEGAKSFHQFLEVDKLRCNLSPGRVAVWRLKRTQVRLSALAACTLANEGLLDFNDIKLFRPKEYETDDGPWEPITGGASAIIETASTMMLGVADFPIETLKALKIHPDAPKAKKEGSPMSDGTGTPKSRSRQSSIPPPQSGNASDRETGPPSPGLRTSADSTYDSALATPSSGSTFNFQESLAKLNSGQLSAQSALQSGNLPQSMAAALTGQLGSPKPRSRSRSNPRSRGTSVSNGGDLLRTTMDTSKGVQRIVGAGLRSPMDFTLGVAKGFHNAPKLYGDDTVRKADHVTDFKSGLKAATKGFGLGMYDGISGLVSQPIRGAAKEGPAGFLKGIGKGIGGIVLKPGAAVFSIPGYTMMGVYKEMQKLFGSSVQSYIIAARTAQGYADWQKSDIEERRLIVERWKTLQLTLKKKRNPDELVRDIFEGQMRKNEQWIDSKKAQISEKRRSRGSSTSAFARTSDGPYHDPESALLAIEAHPDSDHRHRAQTLDPALAERQALDEAIKQSVRETSYGNEIEDAHVERGIRANMHALERQRSSRIDKHEDEMQRALAESAADAEERKQSDMTFDRELQMTLARSLKEHRGWPDGDESPAMPEYAHATPPPYDPGHLAGTTKEEFDQRSSQNASEKTSAEKDEERIVLEYIKKQSLIEEEHRRQAGQATSSGVPRVQVDDVDEKTLQLRSE